MEFKIEEKTIEVLALVVICISLMFGCYSCDDMQRRHDIEKVRIEKASK